MSVVSLPDAQGLCLRELVITPDDVVTVGEAFAGCDARLLLSAVLSAEAGWRFPERLLGDIPRKTLLQKIETALGAMAKMPPVDFCEHDARCVLVPWDRFEPLDAQGLIRHRLRAALLYVNDVENMRHALSECGGPKLSFSRTRADRAGLVQRYGQERWLWTNLEEGTSHLAFEPWGETLALPLWMPQSLCVKERHLMLANIFWTMTYFGFDGGNRGGTAGRSCGEGCEPAPRGCGDQPGSLHEGEEGASCDAGGVSDAQCSGPVGQHAGRDGRVSASARARDPDGEYFDRLGSMASYASYLSWLGMISAFVTLAGCMEGRRASRAPSSMPDSGDSS